MVRRDENEVSRDSSKERVAIRAIVGETTPMRGDGEGHFLTQNNRGAGSVDSWVAYEGIAPEWSMHQGRGGGLLEGSRENKGGPKLWIIWSGHRDNL